MKKIFILPLLLAVFIMTSCEKMFIDETSSLSARENFEYLWKQCDENYSFFEYKEIDWNEVYNRYSPQVYDGMPEQELFDVLANMMNELRDGHVNLSSEFDVSRYTGFYENHPENYDGRLIQDYYIGFQATVIGPFLHSEIIGKENIAYVRLASFGSEISDYAIDFVVDHYKNTTDGMILDLRNNGGGLSTNVYQLGARFTNSKRHAFLYEAKKGPEHDDFTSPESIFIEPEGSFYDKPIMVLVNRKSYSATSFFSTAMHAFPNVTLLGDSTGGGMGAPNGGELPNGWMYRMSVNRNYFPTGDLWENGVPVDIYIDMDDADPTKDEIIERAIEEIEIKK